MKLYFLILFSFVFLYHVPAQDERIIYLTIEQPELDLLRNGETITSNDALTTGSAEINFQYYNVQKILRIIPLNISEEIIIDIYNTLGQKIKSQVVRDPINNSHTDMNLSALPAGIYIARVSSGEYYQTQKIYISK